MVSIGNVDLVMAALRARLEALAKEKRTGKAGKKDRADRGELRDPAAASQALKDLPPREFDRGLVRLLLEGEFGSHLAEDPRFLALVERTCTLLTEDRETEALFRRLQREQAGQGDGRATGRDDDAA